MRQRRRAAASGVARNSGAIPADLHARLAHLLHRRDLQIEHLHVVKDRMRQQSAAHLAALHSGMGGCRLRTSKWRVPASTSTR